jgi:hypothetical protein
MDRVKGPQRRLCERTRESEQVAIEREQRNRLEQLAGPRHQCFQRQARVVGRCASDRAGQLGKDELAGDEIGVIDERSQGLALRLVANELHER